MSDHSVALEQHYALYFELSTDLGVDMSDLLEYEITEEEALKLRLMQSEVQNARLALQLVHERFTAMQTSLSGKYSQYGKYQLVGELNLDTRKGHRTLVPGPEDVDFNLTVEADESSED